MPKVSKNPAPKTNETEVLYPVLTAEVATGDKALTASKAKELLGWEEVEAKDASCSVDVAALIGKNVRMLRNTKNRYITTGWVQTLRQEHLNKKWRFNGEAIVVGKYGNVLSGQHRLLSLICAEHERTEGDAKEHWQTVWPTEVTMETLVVFGVDEGDDTFKTLNCGKPGTFAEVLFRSEHLAKVKAKDRKEVARMADYAIRLLWDRTGEKSDPYHPRRTHGEAMEFLDRHPKLLAAVKHIHEENQTGKDDDGRALPPSIGQYVSPGYAAGILYLMAATKTDGAAYATSGHTAKDCDLKSWDKAEEFWVALSQGVRGGLAAVCRAIGSLADPDSGVGGKLSEKIAILTRAWAAFLATGKVTPKDVDIGGVSKDEETGDVEATGCYSIDEDGVVKFDDDRTFGGIDKAGRVDVSAEEGQEDDGGSVEETKPDGSMTPEQKKEQKKAMAAAVPPVRGNPVLDEVNALRQKCPTGSIMLVKSQSTGNYTAYDGDAEYVTTIVGGKLEKSNGLPQAVVSAKDLTAAVLKLNKSKHKVATVEKKRTGAGRMDFDYDVKVYEAKKK